MPGALATGCRQNATGLPDLEAYVREDAVYLSIRMWDACMYACLCVLTAELNAT